MFSSNTSQVSASGPAQAEAIDFDGTNDTLYRSSLTGAANGKTFTFSAWLWIDTTGTCQVLNIQGGSVNFTVANGVLTMWAEALSPAGQRAFTLETSTQQIQPNTWINVMYSADMANTSNRRLYINDILVTPTYYDYNDYVIKWILSDWYVAGNSQKWDGRLSNVFLDFTYRDLAVIANRRLFVTADLKPAAGQAALNPILYLPMSDPTQPGKNMGTGGDFTLTGTVARSGRGPNQYNAPYSDFDGANDYLQRDTAPNAIADGKQFTFSCVFNADNISANNTIISFSTAGNQRFAIWHNNNGQLSLFGRNSAGTTILNATVSNPTFVIGRNYVVTISIDLSDSGKRQIYINGIAPATVTWSTYTDDAFDFAFTNTPLYNIGCANGSVNFFNGRIGAVWFNTSYIDLSQPANLAKFVSGTDINAAPVDLGANGELPTGTSPLIYLPIYGNRAGQNYGTGGNFTVISGPFTGARGPNEFWGNLAFTSAGGYLSRSSSIGISDGKIFSFSFFFRRTESGATSVFLISNNQGGSGSPRLEILLNSGAAPTRIDILAWDSSGTQVLNVGQGSLINFNTTYHLCGYIDLSNASNRGLYLNGSLLSPTWTTYTNSNIDLSPATPRYWIGAEYSGPSGNWTGVRLSEFYFTTSYIDFNQEANRLKFRDAFGNPVNLTQQIEAAAIPTPAIYMRFPPTSFGTNSGTGGAFTVNGTITDGGQL